LLLLRSLANLQTNGQVTGLSGKPYDFYKQIDVADFLKYLIGRYSEHTEIEMLSVDLLINTVQYFFGTNPHVELQKLAPHKRSWILYYKQSRDLVTTIIGNITIEKLFSLIEISI
jgi:hypothetical protein